MSSEGNKRLSVERIYQKKTQREHILLRPDTYIGSVQPNLEAMWVYDEGETGMNHREITYVPGFYKIFDEILVNAADNKQRDANMDVIKIEINTEKNLISIYNNGRGIPVELHKEQNMYVPTMIFGHLLTSSNFDDKEAKTTGGRNGFGAKLCNVFSKKFTVETADKNIGKSFKQTWSDNMMKVGDPVLKDIKGEDFTKITFEPDLEKFNMASLDKDTVALLNRRAFDIAACCKGVKVFLNGKRLPVKTFKDYVDHYIKDVKDDDGNALKVVYDQCGARWEVAVCVSDKGFQQMSFVNSIATTKGGKHVDHVADQVIKCIIESIKKKNKTGIDIKAHQVKQHLWLFVNALIVNPTFDSQTKETMTLVVKDFGSKCSLTEDFQKKVGKAGIIESVIMWSKFKADTQLKNKQGGKKTNKLRGIAKLEDANEAGTKNSSGCTLILTEGDSAKTLAVAGLGVVGRDYYGVYPLKGKLLNVREASTKQIMENKEITDLVKIIGLQYKKKYESVEDIGKNLRYGKVMIMTDQDQDGSHIKGLVINFIHHNWPSLLKLPFLEEFITPIVKVSKGSQALCFYSLPEFQEWKDETDNWHTWKIKYYKGLGTSTSKEAKEYFSDMVRHKIKFHYDGSNDDESILLAFSKKHIEQRKEWLTNWMEEGRRRKELGLPEVYLYEKDTRAVNYQDFVNKELVLFSNMDNERSIPCLVDGLKPGQRKVLFTCLKRKLDKKEIKVAQLAGSVAEMSAYHHGEASLMGTIINLAQNYVGSNNINLLQPIGQFGTRLTGGKDSASPRYIFTQLSPLVKNIFNENDAPLLKFLTDDNQKIEPDWYIPILPMVLVNGADGIGTGWMTKIPNYNPREIVANLQRMLKGEEPQDMVPWYKNFRGTIESLDNQKYVMNGEVAFLSDTKFEITELPVKVWTNSYKEQLEGMLAGTEKQPACIQDYKDYNTDKTIKFIVQLSPDKVKDLEKDKSYHTFFKLQTTMSTSSMVLFDHLGCLRKYEDVRDILKEFFTLRLEYYGKRKKYMEGLLGAEACKLSNQARFILEKCDGTLKIENKKKKLMIEELQRKGFDSDPLKAWEKANSDADSEEEASVEGGDVEEESSGKGPDYGYLLGMPMWNLTLEKKEEILKKRDEKHQELKKVQGTTKEEMWEKDLSEFSTNLDEVEAKEAEEDSKDSTKVAAKGGKGKKAGGRGAKKGEVKVETLPSADAERIFPIIADELKTKYAKAQAAKERKALKGEKVKKEKKVKDEKDEFDEMAEAKSSLSDSAKKFKQTKINFGKASKPKPKTPWSDEEDITGEGSESEEEGTKAAPAPRQKPGSRAAASKVQKYQEDVSETDSEIFDSKSSDRKQKKKNVWDSSDSEQEMPELVRPAAGDVEEEEENELEIIEADAQQKEERDEFDISDSDDGGLANKVGATSKAATKKKKPPKKLAKMSDLFPTAAKPAAKKVPGPKKTAGATAGKHKKSETQSESEKPAKKKTKYFDSDSDEDFKVSPRPKSKRGAGGKSKQVRYDESETDD